MSVTLYDDAILAKLNRMFQPKAKITIVPPSELFDYIARINQDNILFPLISLNRSGFTLEDANHTLKHDGAFVGLTTESEKRKYQVKNVQVLPIVIAYQLDVFTKERAQNDAVITELIWYFSTRPKLQIEVPYGMPKGFKHDFNLFINADVEDNSDIVEHKDKGILFRQTLTLYTNDAYLWKTSSRDLNGVDPEYIRLAVEDDIEQRR